MHKQDVKGASQKSMGAIKDAAGPMTGNKKLLSEGKANMAEGVAGQQTGGNKDA